MKRRLSLLYACDHNIDRVLTEDRSRRSCRKLELKIQNERKPDYMKTKGKNTCQSKAAKRQRRRIDLCLACALRRITERAILETIIYGLVILSALAAILQFVDQPVLFGA